MVHFIWCFCNSLQCVEQTEEVSLPFWVNEDGYIAPEDIIICSVDFCSAVHQNCASYLNLL